MCVHARVCIGEKKKRGQFCVPHREENREERRGEERGQESMPALSSMLTTSQDPGNLSPAWQPPPILTRPV